MKSAAIGRLAAVAAVVALAAPVAAQANEVTNWNSIAQTTILAQPPVVSAPPAAAVMMAMVHGSIYGAVNAIDRRHRPYLVDRTFPHASEEAAVATAAFRVLDGLFPAHHGALQAQYGASLGAIPDGEPKNKGIEVGALAADAMLAGGHDGRDGPIPPLPLSGVGYWQPLIGPDGNSLLDPSPWVALAQPFLIRSASQFRTAGPNALSSAAYAADVNETERLGALDSPFRTQEETHLAVFWQSNPMATWNGVARRLVDERGLDLTDSAELFGILDLADGDAQINCWNDKYYFGSWRPIAAIRNAEDDGNPATTGDPNWRPLFIPTLDPAIAGVGPPLNTPPFPEHPSGHLCYTAASVDALQAFLGTDDLTFYVTSSRFPGERLYFNRLSDVTAEVREARIWAGIHFRTADEQGALLGERVARYAQRHYFGPLH
jgi:PAP2 superfamily